ncbi:XrtA/PEP-CTERM system TPR-repeat protein PrsT [Aquabacterium sp.]|uniref:XrtA/PEP-CTERM system TPR-repeat protein PrsT n=1 Tax=Aquabacterium sp. TaxID=1872578 RepID=UPI0037837A58
MLPRAWLAASLLVFAVTPSLAASDAKAAKFYEDALTRYEKKDIAGAIVQLKNALQIDSSMLSVHVLLGKALLADGDAGAAEVAFTEALRLGVNRAEVVVPLARSIIAQGKQQQLIDQQRFGLGALPPGTQLSVLLLRAAAYADLGDTRSALKAIDDARALNPSSADAWLAEVPVRIRARQFREAQAAADKALSLEPQSAEVLYQRGTIAHVQGDQARAMADYNKALDLSPTHIEALIARAGLWIDQGKAAEARRDVEAALRSSPRDPRGAYLKSLLDEREGNAAAAREALGRVTALLDPVPLEHFRYRPQALMLGGLAHYALNEREKAKPYLEAVQRQQPNGPVSKLLAQIYLGENNIDRAIESLDAYLKGRPDDAQAVLLLASAHFSQGRHTRAAQLMQDALKTQDVPAMRTMLGLSLVGSGKFADAAKELEAAFAKDPGQLQAGMALTSLYMQSSQAAKAVVIARQLAQKNPGNAGVQNLLGTALARNGDAAAAKTAFEAALKLDAAFLPAQVNLARLDFRAGALDAAVGRLNKVLTVDGKNIDALMELAALQERRGQAADAQRSLEKAADVSGQNELSPALALIDFHLRNGHPELAREATGRVTSKAPDAMLVLLALARVNLANGDQEAARTALTRAARLANYDAPVLLQIASLQMAAGSLPGAAYSLDKALSERPDFLPAQALMTEVELRQGEVAKAEARARQMVAKFPKSGAGHALLGDIAASRGQTAAAIDAYRRAHQLEQSSESLLRVFRVLAVSDPQASIQWAEQWLKGHPRDKAVRRAVADAQARAGNLAAARSAYEAIVKADPDDADVLNNLANVMLMQQDPGALKVAEQALQKRPGAPQIIGTNGWAAFRAGQTDRALQLLRDARLRDPNNPDTRYFLGAVLASMGRKAEARDELEGALRGGRNFASAKEAEKLLATLK